MNPAETLQQALEQIKGIATGSLKVIPLSGDASTRRYYRIVAPQACAILQMAEPFVTKNEFLRAQEFLAQLGIAVPRILASDPAQGAVLQEDLGDTTLSMALFQQGTSQSEERAFDGALLLLAEFHQKARPEQYKGEAPAGFTLAFDVEKLMWEVNFTLEHFFGGYLQKNFSPQDRAAVEKDFTQLCQALAAEPRVYTHRDYHTRNIMVEKTGRQVAIDFQDARMGLRQYDLASLLRDSYYQLEEEKVYRWIDRYWQHCGAMGAVIPTGQDHKTFIRLFDWMSIQRNFKALGTFGFQYSVKKNPYYLRFVGNTYENLRRNLAKYPEFHNMAQCFHERYYG